MELLRVSDSKLKITLTSDDMDHFALRCDEMDYEDTETRRAFWEILGEVKEETGFDATRDRVMIRVFPSRDGGCEMYVTKLENECGVLPVPRGDLPSVFRFGDLASLLSACRLAEERGSGEDGALYAGGDDPGYYLELHRAEEPFLYEFAESKLPSGEAAFVRERLTCLIPKGAISQLSKLK